MEISVGVAYGSPTAEVIELLTEVARDHDEVLEDPEPMTIFTGFGDSALDFELRAWTRGDFVGIASDLRVGMDQILAAHGIKIPFPQRDLHLRTVGGEAAARLTGDFTEVEGPSAPITDSADVEDSDGEPT
jgi:potassium efflux system protein